MPWGTQGTETTFETDIASRGQQRQVRRLRPGAYVVVGDPNLSDTYSLYDVTLVGGKYECACYSHAYGEYRRAKICGHVRDVLAWKKENPDDGGSDGRGDGSGVPGNRDTPGKSEQQSEAHGGGDADDGDRGDKPPRRRRHRRSGQVDADRPLDTRDRSLGTPPLPEQFTEFRPHQWAAIREVLDHYKAGRRVVILDAPTGSGKTLIGEAVRRLEGSRQAIYVCNNKSLQDQFMGDFTYGALLKGRANYPTVDRPEAFPEVSAADCDKKGQGEEAVCSECSQVWACAYLNSRDHAEEAPLAVLNTSYLLSAANYAGMFRERGLVVVDEADELEGELMRHIEVVVSRGIRNWLQLDLPASVSDMDQWAVWLEGVADRLKGKAKALSSRDRKDRRRKKQLNELAEKCSTIAPLLGEDWVVDGYEDARRKRGTVERQTVRFRPVHVRDLGQKHLWNHADRWLLMSATIISPAQMAKDLGLEDHEWASVEVESTFPPERRPIFLDRHVGPVTRAKEETALPALVGELERLAAEWPNERILVHTHSYSLTKYINENLSEGRARFAYSNSAERDGILDRWLATDNGILLAPSFDRGVDLKDGLCRIQVIAKAPYPYLGDKQVKARMSTPGGQTWYTVETIRSIVQATGRVMRSSRDYGATYILDGSVWRLLNERGDLFPSWWREAVVRGLDSQSTEIREGFEEIVNGA